jgi:tetratricopeptide (TPR) repeat protein
MTPFKTTVPRRHTGRAESKPAQTTKSAGVCKSNAAETVSKYEVAENNDLVREEATTSVSGKACRSEKTKQTNHSPECDYKTTLCNAPGHLLGDKNYHPYVNHAACVEHQMWWRNPTLAGAAVVASILASIGLTSVFLLVPNHQLAFVPFAEPSGLHKQAENEFQLLCTQGQSDVTNGRVEAGLGKFKKASGIATVSDKLKAELFNDIAITLHASGRRTTSAEYLEKAVSADPDLIAARSNLALILLELGQKQKAIKVLEEAIKLQPSNNCLVHRLAELNSSSKLSM